MPDISAHVEGTSPNTRGESAVFPIDIEYSTNDPYALRFTFHVGGGKIVCWMVSIELLECALDNHNRSVGNLGIVVMLCHSSDGMDTMSLQLRSPEGEALVLLPAQQVRELVEDALELATDDVKEAAGIVLLQGFEADLRG